MKLLTLQSVISRQMAIVQKKNIAASFMAQHPFPSKFQLPARVVYNGIKNSAVVHWSCCCCCRNCRHITYLDTDFSDLCCWNGYAVNIFHFTSCLLSWEFTYLMTCLTLNKSTLLNLVLSGCLQLIKNLIGWLINALSYQSCLHPT